MSIEIRSTKPDEMRSASDVVGAALMFPAATDEEWAKRELSWTESDSVTAWDGDRCVGHAGAHRFDSTVPGGKRLPMAGVTRVGVLPTYTRRGLLSGMMERLLRDARAEGRVLAGLRASEAVIYGRFGFGVAGEAASVRVRAKFARPVLGVPDGSMRLLVRDEIIEVLTDAYDRCARRRTGSISRPPWYMERNLEDALTGKKPSFVAIHEDASGTVDGFVHYDIAWDESPSDDVARGEVHDLFAVNADAERALWAYLIGIDLIDEWRSEQRPVHEPIRFAFADMRAYKVRHNWDEQWLRLLDVDAALQARTYRACDRTVALDVRDLWFEDNTGAWRIDQSGAVRTGDAPDLRVPIDVLSAAYLGATTWRELADAGVIEIIRPAAVEDADMLFAELPVPFCGSFY
ncbi:MAG: GNAT family N-acetyltransferase [Acidimicrobiia bacterium]